MENLYQLPDNLPVPEDDGACDHLQGLKIPTVTLESVSGAAIDLNALKELVVIFFYPMIGRPGSLPMAGWNDIPGARGCTPQACSYRDNYANFEGQGIKLLGISAQPLEDQKETSFRLNLPFDLLNDSQFELTNAMNLPTFNYDSSTFIKRITIIAIDGIIVKTFYPIFPPDKNVYDVIEWIRNYND